MPPGYAAFFLWTAAAVLWWSGWREETAEGIPDGAVAIFLAGWPVAALNDTVFGEHIRVNGSFLWSAAAMMALVWWMDRPHRWISLSAGMLAGSLHLLLTQTERWVPFVSDWLSGRGAAIASGLVVCLLVQGASGQAAAVTLSLLITESISIPWLNEGGQAAVVGSGKWMESWWIAVLSARSGVFLANAMQTRLMPAFRRRGEESS